MEEKDKSRVLPDLSVMQWVSEELNAMMYFYTFAIRAAVGTSNGMLDTISSTVEEYRGKPTDDPHSFARAAWDYIDFMLEEAKEEFVAARRRRDTYSKNLDEENTQTHVDALKSIMHAIDVDILKAEHPEYSREEAEAFIALNPRFVLTNLRR